MGRLQGEGSSVAAGWVLYWFFLGFRGGRTSSGPAQPGAEPAPAAEGSAGSPPKKQQRIKSKQKIRITT